MKDGSLMSSVEVDQITTVQVLRMPMDTEMRVRLDCNHTEKQVKLQLMRGNYFMRSFEGTYAVLPFGGGKDGCQSALEPPKLPATLIDAIGDDTSREITAKLADVAAELKHGDAENLGELSGNSGCARLAKRQPRSLVILHQRMEPSMRPPPGMGGFVRGQVRRQFERMFSEIQAACETVCASAPASGIKDWVEAVRTSCRNLPVPGQA